MCEEILLIVETVVLNMFGDSALVVLWNRQQLPKILKTFQLIQECLLMSVQ
jgi:hypothetical protein